MMDAFFSKAALNQAIDRFSRGRVLVVGDLAIDEMVYGKVDRLSREAPVLILRHDHTDIILGAASNAAHNLASLGVETIVAGVMGADFNANQLQGALQKAGIRHDGLIVDPDRPTTTKSRISGTVSQSVTQQVVRMDRESREPLASFVQAELLQRLQGLIPMVDAVLLSDYGLGVFQPAVIEACIRQARALGKPVVVDSQGDLTRFAGVTILTPNQPEAEQNLKRSLGMDAEEWREAGRELRQACQSDNLLITRGQDGMVLYDKEDAAHFIPVFNRSEVFDVTGAGDTVVATLTAALATGSSAMEGAVLGNLAASLVVKHYGCAVTTPAELKQSLEKVALTF